jgi:hypothetical protein
MSDREDERQFSALPPLGDASAIATRPRPPSRPGNRLPESPGALIAVGLCVSSVLGGLLLISGEASDVGLMVFLGYLTVVAGAVLTWVGIIAAGVRLGMRWARIDEGS